MKKIIAIIPARMGSSRFYGKPLKLINKIPMIQRVYENVKKCSYIDDVYVATCDQEIKEFIEKIKGNVTMTKKTHTRASDRCAEALKKIESIKKNKYDIVLMVQGDEPMILPQMLNKICKFMLKNKDSLVSNLITKIDSKLEFNDPNSIKLVKSKENKAIYFSRKAIPFQKNTLKNVYKQVCAIPFKRNFLLKYLKLKSTPLEKLESIDMLRVIEYGYAVNLIEVSGKIQSVDTPKDLKRVEKLIR